MPESTRRPAALVVPAASPHPPHPSIAPAAAASLAALALMLAAPEPTGASAAAAAAPLSRPAVPSPSLQPPEELIPVLEAVGEGVQRYVCKEKEGAAGALAWTLKEPEAKLFDAAHRQIGSHSAGPTWKLADGSKVVKKQVAATVEAPSSDAVPWLLVEVEASGSGKLASVAFVQRIATAGGKAPATGCDAAHAGATKDVPYRATYLFYAPRPLAP